MNGFTAIIIYVSDQDYQWIINKGEGKLQSSPSCKEGTATQDLIKQE